MNMLMPLDTVLQQGLAYIERADNTASLEHALIRWDAVLYGYYLSGAVSEVEVHAAQHELRKAFRAIQAQSLLVEQWRAANPEEARA